MVLRLKILFIALFVFCASVGAQQIQQLSLIDAITEGLDKNYSILLARNNEQISSNNVTYGNAGMLPNVNLNSSAGSAVRTSGASNTWNAGVAMDWTVFDGFAMFANYDRLRELEMMGQENLRAAIQQTIATIMNVYFDIVSKQQEIEAYEHILRISRLRLTAANDRFLSGRVARVDVLSAQGDYNADTASYIRQTEDLRKTKIQLNRLLAREITTDFYASDSIIVDQTLSYGRINELAMAENPDVMLSRMTVNVAALTLKSIEGSQYPRLSLTSSYTLAGPAGDRGLGTFNVGVSLRVPLYNGMNINRQIRNATIELESAQIRQEQIQKEIEAQVASSYSTYLVYRDLAAFEARNLGLAAENLEISMDRYRLGATSAVELRDVQRSYIAATNRLIVATYNAKISETALKLLTGEILNF